MQEDWKKLIPGCFGNNDHIFALHPCDKERAKKMLHLAIYYGYDLEHIIPEIKFFLVSIDEAQEHINIQIKKALLLYDQLFSMKSLLKSAWLITWEDDINIIHTTPINNYAFSNRVAFIQNYRLSDKTIKNKIEDHYLNNSSSLLAKVSYAKNKKNNPYPAQYYKTWSDRIICGPSNKYLYGRKVKQLKIATNHLSQQIITWEEIPIPILNKIDRKCVFKTSVHDKKFN